MALMVELIFIGYLLVRRFGGPGAEKLAAAMGIFGAAAAPFVYKSVDWWRTIHPQTSVMKTLGERSPGMWSVVWFCTAAFLLLFVLLPPCESTSRSSAPRWIDSTWRPRGDNDSPVAGSIFVFAFLVPSNVRLSAAGTAGRLRAS